VSHQDSSEGDRPAPQRNHGLWSTVQAAVTDGWSTTFRLLLIMTGLATLLIAVAALGAGTPITTLLQTFH
jgi:hypothetical protein